MSNSFNINLFVELLLYRGVKLYNRIGSRELGFLSKTSRINLLSLFTRILLRKIYIGYIQGRENSENKIKKKHARV